MRKDIILLIDCSLSVYKSKEKILSYCSGKIRQAEADGSLVTICLFSDRAELICIRQPAVPAGKLLGPMYINNGNSAIYDAICSVVRLWDEYAAGTCGASPSAELYIITDGLDNGSVRNSFVDAAECIKERENAGWKMTLLDMKFSPGAWEALGKKGTGNESKH